MASLFEPLFPTYVASEYVVSSGDHKIDTGVVATQNTKIECWFEVLESKTNGLLFGCREGWQMTNSLIYMPKYTSEKDLIQIGEISERVQGVPLNTRCKVEVNNKQISTYYIDDNGYEQVVMRRSCTSNFTTPGNIYILGGNSGDRPFVAPVCKMYSFKIWENGTLVRDFAPLEDPSDDRSALYDNISQKFYFPETGEALDHGPASYEAELEYVVTSSGGGYDLPIQPKVSDLTGLQAQLEFVSGNDDLGVAIGDRGPGTSQFKIFYGRDAWVLAIHGWNASQTSRSSGKDTVEVRVMSDSSYYWQVTRSTGQTEGGTFTGGSFSDALGVITVGHPASGSPTQKVYGLKWYTNQWQIVHDYIPVLAQGEPCLYDKITGDLIRPRDGLGSVTAGPITYMKLPPSDTIEKVYINGVEQQSIKDADGNAIWPRNSY